MADFKEQLLGLQFHHKLIGLVVAVVLILGGYVLLSYKPKYELIQQRTQEALDLQRQKTEKEIIAANLPAFREEYERLNEQLQQAVQLMPDRSQIPQLLFSIAQLVEQSGLQLRVFEPQPEIPQDFYADVPVSIDVTGEFKSLAVFLDKLGKLPRIVNMTDLSVQTTPARQGGRGGGIVDLRAKGKITTYRFLPSST